MSNKISTMSGQEAFNELVTHFMGKNYYIVDPLSNDQANAIILNEIKKKYPRPFKKRLARKLSEKLKYWSECL